MRVDQSHCGATVMSAQTLHPHSPDPATPAVTQNLLQKLFAYRRWANDELLATVAAVAAEHYPAQREAALRLINHYYLVDCIFRAHLAGEAQRLTATNTPLTPTLEELGEKLAASDRWYQHYVQTVTAQALAEKIGFVFTDGDRGCMSREEMLLHVVTHSGYHRGEVGRVLMQTGVELPWDTFAVFLHRSEPARRLA